MTRKRISTNDVVRRYSKLKETPKLTMKKMDRDTILIEGDSLALRLLGDFILAHATADKDDCHNGLHPRAAGSAWFTKDSSLGFYLHKLPCPEKTVLAKAHKQSK
ncbi:MAG TPA: hypothetical protein VE866_02915 [Candidatus Binatia bacterium]|nr:hypothetical protein [Candidatus Binatia bacterium]